MATFQAIAEVEEEFHELDVEGRVIPYRHRAGGVVWFDFSVICGWGRSQHDYLDISKRFHTVLVSDVPRMGLALAEEARRFTLLVDVFYDNRVKLVVSAEAQPEQLLKIEEDPGDARLRAMVFEFDRTASRLREMQSQEYLAQSRAPAASLACRRGGRPGPKKYRRRPRPPPRNTPPFPYGSGAFLAAGTLILPLAMGRPAGVSLTSR